MHGLLAVLCLFLIVPISLQQCPNGWRQSEVVSDKCYFVTDQQKIWFDAENYCKSAPFYGNLVSIMSVFENANVDSAAVGTLSGSICQQFWLGGNDIAQLGKFEWTDGNPWIYQNWDAGQPAIDSTDLCVSSKALSTGKWRTEPCGAYNCFICEIVLTTRSTLVNPTIKPQGVPLTNKKDCLDWIVYEEADIDGIYPINPNGWETFNVFCDMSTDGGGWTVFQRRLNGDVSFHDESWKNYKVGFNNGLENNLWLGNDRIHALTTKDANVELRIDLWGDRNPNSPNHHGHWWEKWTNFSIDSEANYYTLHLSSTFAGNATMDPKMGLFNSNNMPFATVDSMNNAHSICFSTLQRGGWWLNGGCGYQSPNGRYNPIIRGDGVGFVWSTGSYNINPKQSRMMLRSVL